MERLKKIAFRCIFIPAWLICVLAVASYALLIWVFANGTEQTPLAYASYFASAYSTTVLGVNARRLVRGARASLDSNALLQRALHSPQGERLRADPIYRTEVSLYVGMGITLLYAAVKLICGLVFRSLWFGALAGYYLLLALLKFILLHHVAHTPVGKNLSSEWRRYRLCGAVLLVMNQALAVVVILVVHRNSGIEYPGYLIYVMAGYTFYAVINAVRNMVKFRKHGSPVLSAAKAVGLVAALVSLLSLETAMLTQFGQAEDAFFRRIMTGCTGGAVCVIVLSMAIYMLVHSTKEIRKCKDVDE